jgi:uncharacterized protein
MEEKFQKIKEIVERELSCSAHNMDHIMRVYNLSLLLAKEEDVDMDVLKASILLHDIARAKEDNDPTGNTDHAILGSQMAIPILQELNFPEEKIKHIQNCIISHRSKTENKPQTIEAKILFDADKLEVVGAIGVARAFVWIGKNNAKIYRNINLDEYIQENLGGKINGRIQDTSKHCPQIEYETKIKHIIDKLHTPKAKQIGLERQEFYKKFLDRLEQELNGEL